MERALPDLPFEREPRSAGFPPSRHSRQSDLSQTFPASGGRFSDPGPTASGHYRGRNDYNRNYSVASTASSLSSTSSSSSSLFGNSYSMSTASSSAAEEGYLSPPSSRRTSEATKLPSIHELANLASPIELQATSSSPTKRGSLATITEETPNPHQGHSFPVEYSESNVASIHKTRSNSYPPSSHGSYPPPPPFTASGSASHHYPPEPHSKRIVQALVFNRDMSRLIKDFEMIQEESRQLYHFASRYKDSLVGALSQGSEQTELPSEEMTSEQLARVEQIDMRLRDISAHRTVVTSFRPPNFVKHEEDTRMHDVVSNSSKYYNERYQSVHPMYQDSISPHEQYWGHHEGGRSKYKKRSRAAPPGRCHSCNIESTPEWRRGPDGARTLCNACGLHYAKVSKRNQRDERHPSQDGMTPGLQNQENRQ